MLSTVGAGPITAVMVNGRKWKQFDGATVFCPTARRPSWRRCKSCSVAPSRSAGMVPAYTFGKNLKWTTCRRSGSCSGRSRTLEGRAVRLRDFEHRLAAEGLGEELRGGPCAAGGGQRDGGVRNSRAYRKRKAQAPVRDARGRGRPCLPRYRVQAMRWPGGGVEGLRQSRQLPREKDIRCVGGNWPGKPFGKPTDSSASFQLAAVPTSLRLVGAGTPRQPERLPGTVAS